MSDSLFYFSARFNQQFHYFPGYTKRQIDFPGGVDDSTQFTHAPQVRCFDLYGSDRPQNLFGFLILVLPATGYQTDLTNQHKPSNILQMFILWS